MKQKTRRGRPREFDTAKALRGAMELFWRRGYDASTLPELQAAMGNISPPSFYAAFGSKEKVFADAVALYRTEVACDASRALADGATAQASVAGLVRASLTMFTGTPRQRGCLFILGAVNSTNPTAEALLRQQRREGLELIRARIKRGMAEGDVPKTTDADRVATFYATMLNGLAFAAADGMPATALARVADSALEAWDGLVATKMPRRRASRRRA